MGLGVGCRCTQKDITPGSLGGGRLILYLHSGSAYANLDVLNLEIIFSKVNFTVCSSLKLEV